MSEENGIKVVDVPRPKRFVDALDAYLNGVVLPKYLVTGKNLNRETLEALRTDIRTVIGMIIRKASFETADDMLAWLSDRYFLAIKVNGVRLEQLPGVITSFVSTADLTRVSITCLRLYLNIFRNTDIGDQIEKEIRRR